MKRDFTEEERKAIAEYSRRIVHPTPEEKDESTRKYEENWAKFRARHHKRRNPMVFRITYRTENGIYESIVSAETEFEALLMVKKENPIDGKLDIRNVTEITESGVLSTNTIKHFKRFHP